MLVASAQQPSYQQPCRGKPPLYRPDGGRFQIPNGAVVRARFAYHARDDQKSAKGCPQFTVDQRQTRTQVILLTGPEHRARKRAVRLNLLENAVTAICGLQRQVGCPTGGAIGTAELVKFKDQRMQKSG